MSDAGERCKCDKYAISNAPDENNSTRCPPRHAEGCGCINKPQNLKPHRHMNTDFHIHRHSHDITFAGQVVHQELHHVHPHKNEFNAHHHHLEEPKSECVTPV